MVSFFSIAALVLFSAVLAQNLTVNTPPSVVQCQPTQLSWSGGTGPYFLSFIPAGQPSAPAIKQFPTQTGNTFTWVADLAAGTSFTISLKDSNGAQQFSDIVTVQSGPDSSCINTSVTETGTGGSAAPTSGGSSATTTGGSAPSAGSTTSAKSGTSSTGSAPASTGTSSGNGAYSNRGNALAVAGVMGLVGAALF